MGNITELSQGSLEGLKKQVCECIDHAQAEGYKRGYTKGKNDGHAQGCHTQAEKDKAKIDQAKQEGYDIGLEIGKKQAISEDKENEMYNTAIEDLTHAMKVYFPLNSEERLKHFGINTHVDNYAMGNPKDLIAKAKAYKEKKQAEEEIEVGDEVQIDSDRRGVVISIREGWCRIIMNTGFVNSLKKNDLKKTGRNFSTEVSQLLDKLKGDK